MLNGLFIVFTCVQHDAVLNILCQLNAFTVCFLFSRKLTNKKLIFNIIKGILIINIGLVILVLLLKQLYIFFCILQYNSIITRHFLFC